jgi:nodulation protein E
LTTRPVEALQRDRIITLADRYSWFAAAAADEAVRQSGLKYPFEDPYRTACIVGSGAGGLTTFENAYRDLFIHNKRATNPLTLLRIIGSSAAAHVGMSLASRVDIRDLLGMFDRHPRHRLGARLHS